MVFGILTSLLSLVFPWFTNWDYLFFKLYTLNSCLGFYFYVNQGGFFFGSLRGLVGYWFTHLGFLLSEPLTFYSRLGFYFYVSQAWKGGFFGLSGVR